MNPSTNSQVERTVSIERLVLLHEEILALVRSGVPLDSGLKLLGDDLPGRLGRIARSLSESIARGMSLDEALEQHTDSFPPVYRAVVRAGLRSGRLTAAMESLSVALSRIRDARESVAAGMVYPMLVVLMTIFGSVFFCIHIAPRIFSIFDEFGLKVSGPLAWCGPLGFMPLFWIILGCGFALALFFILRQSRRNLAFSKSSALSGLLALLPWSRRLMHATRSGMFVDVLALLLKCQVPLGEAIRLAAESVGDARLVAGCKQLNQKIERGETIPAAVYREIGLPPLASWALVTGQNQGDLVNLLEHAGETYQLQAESASVLLRQYVPVILTGLFAGGAVFIYVLSLFIPYTSLIHSLG